MFPNLLQIQNHDILRSCLRIHREQLNEIKNSSTRMEAVPQTCVRANVTFSSGAQRAGL